MATPEDTYQAVASIEAISREQKQQFEQVLASHVPIFSEKPGRNKLFQDDIQVIPGETFYRKTYPILAKYLNEVEEYLKLMLEWEIVWRDTSPYSSPMAYVRKKEGTVRRFGWMLKKLISRSSWEWIAVRI
ncbi:hypothetical protein PR048_024532 [Dryococelus australis]|uniref:Uncharacterized protein n=1 Tax=Dryococelus australis TaxID=614101 RepID=A0ABQ9GNV3_9NEOP|nr:hypothetical protein PR048_024532 [Dryococelus australis]